MNENQRKRRNEYQRYRRKRRNRQRIEKSHEDALYEEARIDPDTVEGQSRLDINRISPVVENSDADETTPQPIDTEQTPQGWLSYLTWGLL